MADFHKVPFVILAAVVLVLAGSLVHFWRSYREPLPPEYGWGDADTLALNITLERTNIHADEPVNYTATIKNAGAGKVRIYPWDWYFYFKLRISNGTGGSEEGFDGRSPVPDATAPRPSDSEFNRMLVVLEPNGTYRREGSVRNDASWDDGWPLRPGTDCELLVQCSSHHYRGYPALPVWAGTLRSGWVGFSVLP
jgi:hypothetical protein